jgi:hypothetical protein
MELNSIVKGEIIMKKATSFLLSDFGFILTTIFVGLIAAIQNWDIWSNPEKIAFVFCLVFLAYPLMKITMYIVRKLNTYE